MVSFMQRGPDLHVFSFTDGFWQNTVNVLGPKATDLSIEIRNKILRKIIIFLFA